MLTFEGALLKSIMSPWCLKRKDTTGTIATLEVAVFEAPWVTTLDKKGVFRVLRREVRMHSRTVNRVARATGPVQSQGGAVVSTFRRRSTFNELPPRTSSLKANEFDF